LGKEAVIQPILESAHRALEQVDVAISDLTAIGVGAPGLLNPETGILFTSPNLPGWLDVPLGDITQERLGKKTFISNNANAASLALQDIRRGEDLYIVFLANGVGNKMSPKDNKT